MKPISPGSHVFPCS